MSPVPSYLWQVQHVKQQLILLMLLKYLRGRVGRKKQLWVSKALKD